MSVRRILLPGLTLPVDDYAAFAAELAGQTVVLDTLAVPVTGSPAELRAGVALPGPPYELIGHSVGALAALEWAAEHPREVSRLVLLDPSDPWGTPVPSALGGLLGRVLTGLVGLISLSPPAARALGRWGRRTVLGMYGVTDDPLPRDRVDELFGTRTALRSTARQVAGVPALIDRVQTLLDSGFTTPNDVVLSSLDGAPADGVATSRLADFLGVEVILVPGTHLFPMTHPESTAAALTRA